jgi:hypothetical protein
MLLGRIDAFLRRTKMSATRFGRDAVRDPNFVLNLRGGREPRPATRSRVLAFIAAEEAARERKEALR